MRKLEKLGTWGRSFLLLSILCFFAVYAQAQTVTGVVKDQNGDPVIGATVKIVGSKAGTVTDSKGHYSIEAPNGSILSVSYIGYLTKQMRLRGENVVDITLAEDNTTLNDLVVVGYGTQKKKLVTGATVQVKGEEIAKLNTTNALEAMASSSPGVQITQASSQPGKGFKVSIRGLGTTGGADPLYVIDGVAGGNIDGINPNDIESIDVLKDAASAAIYGSRAANGVILVTTKQGKEGKVELTYNGSIGWSNVYKRPQLLNAQQYMTIMNESTFNQNGTFVNYPSYIPADIITKAQSGWEGTDWWDSFNNKNAKQQNHSVTLAGGTDRSKFNISYTYTGNEGVMGGDMASYYKRHTIRVNSDHVLLKAKDFDAITIGENISLGYNKSHDLAEDGMYWSYIHGLLQTNPLVPQYADVEQTKLYNHVNNGAGWNDYWFNNPYEGLSKGGFNSLAESRNFNANATAFLTIQPIKGLKYRSQFNYSWGSSAYRNLGMPRSPSSGSGTVQSWSVSQNMSMTTNFSLENTLSYDFPVFSGHKLSVLVGQSYQSTAWSEKIEGSNKVADGKQLATLSSFDKAYLTNINLDAATDATLKGDVNQDEDHLASFFGRVNWDYNEKYMATFIMRSDGSSQFADGKRWGTFPSVSAGWVLSNEDFMKGTSSWMDFFKIRASWGQNGNNYIPNDRRYFYLAKIELSPNAGYKFASDMATTTTGTPNSGAYAPQKTTLETEWEKSEQLDFGFDARFLGSRLGVNFDWYKKTTKNWLIEQEREFQWGAASPYINGGDVENTGVEVALTWNDKLGSDFNYNVGVNFAYNKNEVTRINNLKGYIIPSPDVSLSQGTENFVRAEVGHPIGYFFGMSYSGIWQNQAQIDAANAASIAAHPELGEDFKGTWAEAVPGDCIWDDWNGDGKITHALGANCDRHEIGKPNPDVTLGVNLGFSWKGLDFAVNGTGAFGMQIMRSYRSFGDAWQHNYDTTILNRWHGEGTSNDQPRISATGHSNTLWISNRYMEDADYFKIKTVTLGYDFKKIWKTCPLQQLRFYVQAQNLYTFTGYTGLDPEVGNAGGAQSWVRGVDLGLYPSARTYTVGASIKF